MSGLGIFMTIIIGGLAGWIAEKIMKADMGIFANIGLGILGAFVANFLLGLLDLHFAGLIGQAITAVIGACILIYAYRAIKGAN
ncbi:MAG: GlsB/YeaQ/YmgE family stress response membrane protein [Pseudomonadota bacterium]